MSYPPFHPNYDGTLPMLMTREEFAGHYPAEDEGIERKQSPSSSAIREAAVALSNAEGGLILVGVADDGTVVGQELSPTAESRIHEHFRSIHNPGRYQIHEVSVDGTPVTVVAVAQRHDGFAQTSDGRVLVRRGAHNVALYGADLRSFVSERSLVQFERTKTEATLDGVSQAALEALAEAFRWSDPGEWSVRLREHGFLARDASQRLTVAGALHLLDDPSDVVPKAYVEFLRYPGASTEYDRRIEIRGPLSVQVLRATELIEDELGREVVVLGVRRHELPRIPTVVVREAIANAVAHRSYETSGRTSIRVEVRSDRVTIESPGRLPEPVTIDNIRETQAARNPVVIGALRRFELAEDVGRGVDVMQDVMSEELLDPPVFTDTGHSVVVRLPVHGPVSAHERAWIRELELRRSIEPKDRVLLVHAARGEALTNTRARELLGTESPLEARAALHRLRDAELLTQTGRRGGVTYRMASGIGLPGTTLIGAQELMALVLELARSEGRVTNASVRAATGLERQAALRVLEALVETGELERHGERRGTHYVLPDALELG